MGLAELILALTLLETGARTLRQFLQGLPPDSAEKFVAGMTTLLTPKAPAEDYLPGGPQEEAQK